MKQDTRIKNFNSTIVRLREAEAYAVGCRNKFQFNHCAIKSVHGQHYHIKLCSYFNSTIVRLRELSNKKLKNNFLYFNSTIVRLRVVFDILYNFDNLYFNSTIVRLRVSGERGQLRTDAFQFNHCAIKRRQRHLRSC